MAVWFWNNADESCFHLFQIIVFNLPKSCYIFAWHQLVFLVNQGRTKNFFTLNTWQPFTRNSPVHKFFSDVFLLPRAPSSIFISEFLIYDSTVVKFRLRTLQPTGRANLMKIWNIYKTAFVISLHRDIAAFCECNFNTENVETFIVLAHLLPTQSSLNFG